MARQLSRPAALRRCFQEVGGRGAASGSDIEWRASRPAGGDAEQALGSLNSGLPWFRHEIDVLSAARQVVTVAVNIRRKAEASKL